MKIVLILICHWIEFRPFHFENYLQTIKKFVRKTQNPLAQIVKRVKELEAISMGEVTQKAFATTVSKREKDSWFLLKSGDIAQLMDTNNDHTYECNVINRKRFKSLCDEPCQSSLLTIIFVTRIDRIKKTQLNNQDDLLRKVVCLPYKDGFVFPFIK